MDSLKELMEQGELLGYEGESLREFVREQQAQQREERAAQREKEMEAQQREERVAQREKEREEREYKLALEKEREEREYKLALEKLELEIKAKQIDHEHQLELLQKQAELSGKGNVVFQNVPKGPKIPAFEDGKDDMDSYLRRFERYAEVQKWPTEMWATHLSALLKGRALDVYASMPSEQALNYNNLKEALLKRYDLTEDGFRLKFRTGKPETGETFQQFSVRLASYLRRWLEMSKTEHTFKALFDVIMRDQFVQICNRELALFLKERTPTTIDEMKKAQEDDPTLRKLFVLAEKGQLSQNRALFYKKQGLLYRKFKSSKVENGKTFTQFIVPQPYRTKVLKLAHESIMSGHLGTKRTVSRILAEFFWPGVQAEGKRFCQSCDICQRTITKGRVCKVPLEQMPLIDEPFKRVAVDLVGPLKPATEKGNRYILTLVDYATRYPEAVALKGIEAERVAEALVDIFCRIGVPREMLTDMGTQFTSTLMSEVSRLISLKQLTTTPYHPLCNGLVERFNGTLKQMLKRLCAERPQDWDKYLSAVLFAYREVPQESLGFSPFELVYGHSVRGPMSILKELWTKEVQDDQVRSTYQYVIDLRERLELTRQMAKENLEKSARRHKYYYNKKARQRNMKVGEKVLVLLPTDNNKLTMQWKGPYTIKEKLGNVDYRLEVNRKIKTFHANMLKHYVQRENQDGVLALVNVAVIDLQTDEGIESHDGLVEPPSVRIAQGPNEVKVNSGLAWDQIQEVRKLLYEYSDVLSDSPGYTSLASHDIRLLSDTPVRVKPYPLPFAMRDVVDDEVRSMLQMDIIEYSDSPYSSPIVIVKKKDGTNRFCIDFRRLNKITIFDAEPMPNADEIFAKLNGCRYISKLDLSKGYWQLPLTESAKGLTAFQTPMGLFQFKVMPFGLVNAPASFSRLMRKLLQDMQNIDNFIDDIIIYTTTFGEHMQVLKELLIRLRHANLTAKPSKCYIGFQSLECLGHIVGNEKLEPVLDKVKAIKEAKQPETKKQVKSFLGLVGFYRKFIPNFASIATPLTDLTRKGQPNKIVWEQAQENAFHTLKNALTRFPILKLPDVDKTFILQTDASENGIGAVLSQMDECIKMPIAYASRKYKKAETHYATVEKECLAIVWAIQKFQRYLYGREFILETDHQPLVYLNKSKCANARLMHWALVLQPYRFQIVAIKGSENVGADCLSRL
ncbi:uncharacterized protein LOC121374100 [Gigantopelta aegis]|uniref:uncharacterized protein LOC121374100 n=1 Tax=Gigantopelta aegis TaxID=1735272 RepID=UPI001B88C6C1|nr:uncharacterized protein LOC121374100 [Gigantopelta aegis]XP_041356961.1 uncharacterized protein LOC121374100 [Gigantopelta aegis]